MEDDVTKRQAATHRKEILLALLATGAYKNGSGGGVMRVTLLSDAKKLSDFVQTGKVPE